MIRMAEDNDAKQIADLLTYLNANTLYSFSNQSYDEDLMKRILNKAKQDGRPYLVCDIDGEIAGATTYFDFNIALDESFLNAPRSSMVEGTTAVNPNYQNTGIAYALKYSLLDYAASKGLYSIWGCCLGDNEDGYSFILKSGYNYVTTISNFKQKFGKYQDLVMFEKIL